MLTEGIHIQIDQSEQLSERLRINDGIHASDKITGSAGGTFEYLPGRFVPRRTWRQLNVDELKMLSAAPVESNAALSETISLLHLPDHIIKKFKDIGIEKLEDADQLATLLADSKEGFKELNSLLQSFLYSIVPAGGFLEFQGIRVGKGNLETTAHTPGLKLVGMHIDNASGRDLLEFQSEKRRLCINLGLENRFFLFVNKPVRQLVEMVASCKPVDRQTYSNNNSLSDDFFKFYPDYPIVRITQRPYDIYIAPTDCMIHDGSTEGSTKPDIDMTFVGDFICFTD